MALLTSSQLSFTELVLSAVLLSPIGVAGVETRTCLRCNHYQTRIIAALPGGGVGTPQPPPAGGGGANDVPLTYYEFDDPDVPLAGLPIFLDTDGHWAFNSIMFVAIRGHMQGIGDYLFAPDAELSRAMIATILWRLAAEPAVEFSPVFSDVAAGQWYSNAIVWASQNGIVQGLGDGRFNPHGSITREQFAAMLYRYAVFAGVDTDVSSFQTLSGFVDNYQVSAWAIGYMSWANYKGLITGVEMTILAPLASTTRAQTATVLHRFILNIIGDTVGVVPLTY